MLSGLNGGLLLIVYRRGFRWNGLLLGSILVIYRCSRRLIFIVHRSGFNRNRLLLINSRFRGLIRYAVFQIYKIYTAILRKHNQLDHIVIDKVAERRDGVLVPILYNRNGELLIVINHTLPDLVYCVFVDINPGTGQDIAQKGIARPFKIINGRNEGLNSGGLPFHIVLWRRLFQFSQLKAV